MDDHNYFWNNSISERRMLMDKRIYVMADSLRVGKTTAVKVIAEGLRNHGYAVTESYEDWQHNPYLAQSYADPMKNLVESQKWFARRKWEQIKMGGKGIFIQDVAPEMDYNYAETNRRLGRISEELFAEYDRYYRDLDWESLPRPDLIVYLQISNTGLVQRAIDSAREFETVEPEYFLMMKRVNREWLQNAISNHKFSNSQIVFVDTDKLDFAHEEKDKVELTNIILFQIN